jgi:hypothetical protein
MKAKTLLRIGAVLMLLHAAGHTIGALTWKQTSDTAMKRVVEGMLNNHFDFMGLTVSIGDFYSGYGFILIGVLLLLSLLLWILSTEPMRSIILALGFFLVFLSVMELIYFFPVAAAFSLLAGISTLFAYTKSKAL